VDDEYGHVEPRTGLTPEPEVRDFQLPCGCWCEANHSSGERKVVCRGGGVRDVPNSSWPGRVVPETCPGRRGYTITAEVVVSYKVKPLPAPTAE
jgi:hypothetical protein